MQLINSLKNKSSLSIFGKIILLLNFVSAFVLMLSYTALYFSPAKFWIIAFLGLAYPFILILNIIFILYWLFSLNKYCLISIITIALGWNNISKLVQFGNDKIVIESNNPNIVKVMSYNVRNFDIYSCNSNWNKLNYTKRNKIFSYLRSELPNIVCFQEYIHDKTNKFITTDSLKKISSLPYYHDYYVASSIYSNYFGIATFTSYPIVDKGNIKFPQNSVNSCIFTDMIINEDTVRVYNVHLESIKLSPEDYALAENIKTKIPKLDDKETIYKGSRKIMTRLKKAFIKRASQADIIAEHIKTSPYPVIVCGDFNDTPFSYSYHKLSDNLLDAFVESGNGTGNTYIGNMPSFRIDYILHSKSIKAFNYSTDTIQLSDHYPIKSYLKIKNK